MRHTSTVLLRQPLNDTAAKCCARSAFWHPSGHFLVSGYDQKAITTEKAPVLCSS